MTGRENLLRFLSFYGLRDEGAVLIADNWSDGRESRANPRALVAPSDPTGSNCQNPPSSSPVLPGGGDRSDR